MAISCLPIFALSDMAVEIIETCADAALPGLEHFSHYADWLDKHPFQWIKATERLNEM